MTRREPDRAVLEASIATLIERYEREHDCEVSSLFLSHNLHEKVIGVEVSVITRARVRVA